mmetsp:Transcript_30884/g.92555  ORF Transcript_30884/g.92555 Transcript_30884/m.92555 type:complete len:1871 (-) Transcript_30884:814-6426(-)
MNNEHISGDGVMDPCEGGEAAPPANMNDQGGITFSKDHTADGAAEILRKEHGDATSNDPMGISNSPNSSADSSFCHTGNGLHNGNTNICRTDVEEGLVTVDEKKKADGNEEKCGVDVKEGLVTDFENGLASEMKQSVGCSDVNNSSVCDRTSGTSIMEGGSVGKITKWKRKSSLELRKVPHHILLGPDWDASGEADSEDFFEVDDSFEVDDVMHYEGKSTVRDVLQQTCLRPDYSLRKQLMLSFGTVSAVTMIFVMVTSIAVTISAGNRIEDASKESLESWVQDKASSSARYVSDAFTTLLPGDVIDIMHEAIQDRFVGYPTAQFDRDELVPFEDMDTGRRVYPINAKNLSLDWNFPFRVTESNHHEHIQNRWSYYSDLPGGISTAGSLFHMQGACNPADVPGGRKYLINCTDANNDPTSGGAIVPVSTTAKIYSKAKDLDPIFKAIYESTPSLSDLGIFFANSGAGASVAFPQYEIDHTASYTSMGCEWLKETNPFDPSQNLGAEEEIARCKLKGTQVNNSLYNPLERGWFSEVAQDAGNLTYFGPFENAWAAGQWLFGVGKPVFDKITHKFIGCIFIDIGVTQFLELLEEAKIDKSSHITLVRWNEEGTVVASPEWDLSAEGEAAMVDNPKLDVGISMEEFRNLKEIIDFSQVWDPKEVRDKYKKATISSDGKIVSAYPVPPPPSKYDPGYTPSFMALVTIEEQHLYAPFNDLYKTIDEQVLDIVIFTLVVGFVGLAIVLCVIFSVSASLTRPLDWMTGVANMIVDKFGDDYDLTKELDKEEHVFRFSPRTELNDLIHEFKRLVKHFSGDGSAKAIRFRSKRIEKKNNFKMFQEFGGLYQNPQTKSKYDYNERREPPALKHEEKFKCDTPFVSSLSSQSRRVSWKNEDNNAAAENVPQRCHFGPNIHFSDTDSLSTCAINLDEDTNVLKSQLFRWIVVLVLAPLLVLSIVIAAVVMWRISTRLVATVSLMEREFLDMEMRALSSLARLRATQASGVISRAARDLHILTRVAGWLFFGGLNQSNSFTKMETHVEACKWRGQGQCEYVKNRFCDCTWNDKSFPDPCRNYTNDTRNDQITFWVVPEYQPTNSFVSTHHAYAPNQTEWYANISSVPGASGKFTGGYKTLYDRLRVTSATTVIQIPLYNYDVSDGKHVLGTYISSEVDGLFNGYAGCDNSHAEYAFFQSTESNGAASMRPDLCPLGSYGYDPRCRDWYDTGKQIAEEKENAPLYVTPPYEFAGSSIVAQSCTLPLVDPKTGEHIGQTLLDFTPGPMTSSLQKENIDLAEGGFAILITTRKDALGHDTVIGPNYNIGDPGKQIEDLFVPPEEKCPNPSADFTGSVNPFCDIASAMRKGKEGNGTFNMVSSDEGSGKDEYYFSYAPVNVTSFRPVDDSDYTRGVKKYDSTIYSLGFAEPRKELTKLFQRNRARTQKFIYISIAALTVVILIATTLLVWISSRVTVSVTIPIIHLLGLLKNVNRLDNKDDLIFPTNINGSGEVLAVYDTCSMLFKVIRFANCAFFSGNVESAYTVLTDALRLFRSLGNKKAIGVASNNLGNCMLTMYRMIKEDKSLEAICGLSKGDMLAKGTSYFRDAIKLGEEAYDVFYEQQGWSGSCLVFMQHLSSRYFNRALFLLTVKNDHEHPEEVKQLGFRDLDISKNMDVEVADQCLEVGFSIDEGEQFEMSVSRIRGLLVLKEMGYRNEWDTKELIDETFYKLRSALKCPSSDFFRNVSPAGCMQQLDVELIKYARLEGRQEEAAHVAIRMLLEDDYVLLEAQLAAVQALSEYVDKMDVFSPLAKLELFRLQEALTSDTTNSGTIHNESLLKESNELSIHGLQNSQAAESFKSSSSQVGGRRTSSMKYSSMGDFTMEMF